ncbi:MAG: tetratricopeptide repeat protein [Saprospiraceae bacterium]|nr:tetratricopeptide repeat protein [Saprospiraceae bacterium]MDW8484570.1 tetratricopeptide repeat protein [Saprospiraceae bacterium]
MAKRKKTVQQKTSAPSKDRTRWRWTGLILAALAIGLYANTLNHGYVLDDPLAITKNELVRRGISAIPELLFQHYRAGTEGATASALLYRPLSLIAFAVEWTFAPGNPWLGHFMNALWYALTAVLAFSVLQLLLRSYSPLWPAAAVFLFVVHPIHTEVVANIKSRDEIFCLFFCLGALYGWLRALEQPSMRWWALVLGSYLLALLSKESAVAFWPVFPLAAWCFWSKTGRQSIVISLPMLVPVGIFLALRALVLSRVPSSFSISPMDNPIVEASGWAEHTATAFATLWKYLRLLMIPEPLLSDYSYRHLSVVHWTHPEAIAGLLTYGGLTGLVLFGLVHRRAWAFAPAAFLVSIGLYSQLVVVIGTLLGERLLYTPSLWFSLGIAWTIFQLFRVPLKEEHLPKAINSRLAITAFILIGGVFSLQTLRRNADWKDNLTLFRADVVKAPKSVRLNNGLGSELYQYLLEHDTLPSAQKEVILAEIERHSRAALAIRPNHVSYINLGNVAAARKRYDEAVRCYEEALRLAPNYGITRINLSQTYAVWGREEGRQNNRLERCVELLQKAVEYGNSEPDVLLDLGTAHGLLGHNEKAIYWFEKALERDPKNATAWRNLAVAYRAIGDHARAEVCERKAVENQ